VNPYILIIVVLLGLLVGAGIALSLRRRSSVASSGAGVLEADGKGASELLEPAEPKIQEAAEESAREVASLPAALKPTKSAFGALRERFGSGPITQEALELLEASLLRADVGLATTQRILAAAAERIATRSASLDEVLATAQAVVLEVLGDRDRSLSSSAPEGLIPVWLMVGVNGVGKTTTSGKLAAGAVAQGKSVVLAAGDTFRAAAADQLALWAERTGAELVRGAEGADPSSTVFDAVARAKARSADLVIADTAGRLHTKVNLVEELRKIRRVADREPGHVAEVLLVLDATTGQNGLVQAAQFTEAVGVTGVVLTKLDGAAKGGIVVAIEEQLGIAVKLVGLGEGLEDLQPFDPADFARELFSSSS